MIELKPIFIEGESVLIHGGNVSPLQPRLPTIVNIHEMGDELEGVVRSDEEEMTTPGTLG